MRYDAVILGGGASGLAAACALSERGRRVLLLEKQSRVGRKLLATGNGRCNMTNMRAAPEHYHGARAAAARALSLCPPGEVLSFFERMGLLAAEDSEGRVYPRSGQAASVLDALRFFAVEHGALMITGCAAEQIIPKNGCFSVRASENQRFEGSRVLVCTGGVAAPKLGACGDGYRLLNGLGHEMVPRFPAIAALRTPREAVRGLKGQRIACRAALICAGHVLREEKGELLFAEEGVSGIAAMQLARLCGETLRAGQSCELAISLMDSRDEAASMLKVWRRQMPERAAEDFLTGIVPKRVGQALMRTAEIAPMNRPAKTLTDAELDRLAGLLNQWVLPLEGTEGFEQSQITAGGASLRDFHWDTMESRRVPGLYAAGEVLDVDGDCGGYNLQWAWASALIAAGAMDRSLPRV